MVGNCIVPNTGGAPIDAQYILTVENHKLPNAIVVDPGTDDTLFMKSDGAGGLVMAAPSGGGSSGVTLADQVITAAGALVLPHGLSGAPQLVQFQLVCQTGELGYSIGAVLALGGTLLAVTNGGYSAIVDSTNLTIRFGSDNPTFIIPHATTGVSSSITNANWKIRFYCQ